MRPGERRTARFPGRHTSGTALAGVVLLLWLYLTSSIVGLGAEIDSEAER